MRRIRAFIWKAFVDGLIVVIPVYLALLLVAKAAESLADVVRPFALLLPDAFPGEWFLSVLLVLAICFLIGVAVHIPLGEAVRERIESALFLRIPGYQLCRSLTRQLAGASQDNMWKPALAEIEGALVPAFIIEEHEDGSRTVFVPSVPTPVAGTVYILAPDRVHPLDVSMAQAVKSISRWGLGSKHLVAAMKTPAGMRSKNVP